MSKKKEIKIDYTDWYEAAARDESFIADEQGIFQAVEDGKSTGRIAADLLASRAEGIAPVDIARPDKALLHSGMMTDVAAKVTAKKHEVRTNDGKTFRVRDYAGQVKTGEDEDGNGGGNDVSYVASMSDKGAERAKNYLECVVPGHIWNRIMIVFEREGIAGVEQEVAKLNAKIAEMVERLR